jgi:hypothetical protein
MISSAGRYNLRINQGTTFLLRLTWKYATEEPVDLTGCTAELKVSKRFQGLHGVEYIPKFLFSTDPGTEDGELTLGDDLGTILIEATADQTDAFDWGEVEGAYDLYITFPDEAVVRLLDGSVLLSRRQA